MEDMKIHRNAGDQVKRCEKRWEIMVDSLENELEGIKKAHAKRDPANSTDVVQWHIQKNMIIWLEVHIKMMKDGVYYPKEVPRNDI